MAENAILPRPMGASFVHTSELVMPNDTNPHGTLSGGRLMHWIDLAGAMSAMRHARRMVVTAAIDDVVFHAPIPTGHMVLLDAVVTCVGRTSMEVRVDVRGENPVTGEGSHTTTARLVFVALEDGVPVEVPAVVPETDDEKALHERALRRRRQRLEVRGC
ncbi:MAG: acyl-CoA thioesterase [Acidobacteria bacterium]|nr:acyl-CoA thioesterase [Acidobacteriota bacterium]